MKSPWRCYSGRYVHIMASSMETEQVTTEQVSSVAVKYLEANELHDAALFCILLFFNEEERGKEMREAVSGKQRSGLGREVLTQVSNFMQQRAKMDMLKQLVGIQLNELQNRFDSNHGVDSMFVALDGGGGKQQTDYAGFAEVFQWHVDPTFVDIVVADENVAWRGLVDQAREGGERVCVPKIANVCVTPALRRKGLGRTLVQACLDEARRWGAPFAVLQVDQDNVGARRFYREIGFQEVGLQTDLWRYNLSGRSLKSERAPKILMRYELLPCE